MNVFKKFFLLSMLYGSMNTYAATILLDFEGLNDQESIGGFYNGGTSSNGNRGPNLGVAFSNNSLALIDSDAGGTGIFEGEPSPSTIMFFRGASSIMNVAAGFDTGFSFFYAAVGPGSVSVFDDLNGTGNLLATLTLPITPLDPTGQYSSFVPVGVGFNGTARSVSLTGPETQLGFDNVTFGAVIPGGSDPNAIPEPETIALVGLGLLGLAAGRRRRSPLHQGSILLLSLNNRDSSRSRGRILPLYAFRAAPAFPSGVRGPVNFSHGFHCRIKSDCRAGC
ncbi:MAG: hypothetical protein ABS69_10975 [Nitrosomonadales bacterium SCN 54-20]|nr:MAG: hypothetical protein ABS69_10975 [Nitrosomonadales bacterium SCN 54-20]